MTKNSTDGIVGAILLILCAWLFHVSLSFSPPVLRGYPGAAFFPQLILSVIALFSVLLIARSLFRASAQRRQAPSRVEPSASREEVWPFVFALGGVLAMTVAIPLLGFEIACVGYLGGCLFYRTRQLVPALTGSVIGMLAIYAIFVLALKIQLPLTFLPRYI